MSIFASIFLGIIQGITESMPVSSTANMILAKEIFKISNYPEFQTFITFINIGTLIAVILFYWSDCWKILLGFKECFFEENIFKNLKKIRNFLTLKNAATFSDNKNFFIQVCIATVPAIFILGVFRCAFSIDRVCTQYTLFIGILSAMTLMFFDLFSRTSLTNIKSYSHAFCIGIVQIFAVIPGISRLGVCLTVMRLLGYSRQSSLKFSFIISIPILAADIIFNLIFKTDWSTYNHSFTVLSWNILPHIFAFIFGLISLKLVTMYVKNHTFSIFCIYKIVLFLYVFLVVL